jgi:hypothetical protein
MLATNSVCDDERGSEPQEIGRERDVTINVTSESRLLSPAASRVLCALLPTQFITSSSQAKLSPAVNYVPL